MKPFKLKKVVEPAGYTQFWKDARPPAIIAIEPPKPVAPFRFKKKT